MDKSNFPTQLNDWEALAGFGIKPLTGEACALSLRHLCDVSEDGKALLSEYLGIPGLELAAPMNSSVGGQPSVGSLMLPLRAMFSALMQFAAFRAGALAIFTNAVGYSLAVYDEETLARYQDFIKGREGYELLRNPLCGAQQPHQGTRNIHAFTGRLM